MQDRTVAAERQDEVDRLGVFACLFGLGFSLQGQRPAMDVGRRVVKRMIIF